MNTPGAPTFTVHAAITWLLILTAAATGWVLYAFRKGRRS